MKRWMGMSEPCRARGGSASSGPGCNNDGESTVSGGGLGLPIFNATKNAYYAFVGTVQSTPAPPLLGRTGELKVCGRLDKMLSGSVPMGAACGATKGWDGRGRIEWEDGSTPVYLSNLGWKVTVLSVVHVSANAVAAEDSAAAKAKPPSSNDNFTASLQFSGGQGCANKVSGDKGNSPGATQFDVTGSYSIDNGPKVDRNGVILTCKEGFSIFFRWCLYDPKKPGASG